MRSSSGYLYRVPGSRCLGVSVVSDAALEEVPGPGCDGDAGPRDHGAGVLLQVDWEVQGSEDEVCNRGRPCAKLTPVWQGGGEGKRRSVGGGSWTQNLTLGLGNGLGRRRRRGRRDRGVVLA